MSETVILLNLRGYKCDSFIVSVISSALLIFLRFILEEKLLLNSVSILKLLFLQFLFR